MKMSSFKVRLITEKDDDLKSYVVKTIANETWQPGLGDIDVYLAFDPTCFYLAELDGQPIGFVMFVKYDFSFCFFGYYIIENKFRGKGYGIQLYKTALKSLSPSHNIAAYAADDILQTYIDRSGFHGHWSAFRYDVDLPAAYKILGELPSAEGFQVQTIDKVDMEGLVNYDTSVFGYPRQKMVETFLHTQGSHARVAIDNESNIVGYTAARVTFLKEEGYRLGPLYADSLQIAQALLKALFEEMLEKGLSSSPSVFVDCQRIEDKKLFNELLNGKPILKMTYMTTKGIPKGRLEKSFAMFAVECG